MRARAENVTSLAYSDHIVVSTRPIILLGFTIYSSAAAAQFIQLHNSATLPADDAVPVLMLPVAATDFLPGWWGSEGRYFSNGLVICNSSLPTVKAIGAADCWFDIQVATPIER